MDRTDNSSNSCLFVEVELLPGHAPNSTDSIRLDLAKWLTSNFVSLRTGQIISSLGDLSCANLIRSVSISDCSGANTESNIVYLRSTKLEIQCFTLHDDSPLQPIVNDGEEKIHLPLRVVPLPHASFHGVCESLVFESDIPARLVRFTHQMMRMAAIKQLNSHYINFNRLTLLHGLSGTGKSTLCRALAQRLSIRLHQSFSTARFVEFSAQGLFSKFFGESASMVNRAFDFVFGIAADTSTLVCVLIDEVESIAGSRVNAIRTNEVADGIRVTNQLLVALDKMRQMPNVVMFCTSNLLSAIDAAFLDRVDLAQHIPLPSPAAAYEILRSCFTELIRCNIVKAPSQQEVNLAGSEEDLTRSVNHVQVSGPIQSISEVRLSGGNGPSETLWELAQTCDSLSGRTLRRLPFVGLALYSHGDHCTIQEALEALAVAIKEEKEQSDQK